MSAVLVSTALLECTVMLAQEQTQPPQPPLVVDNAACLDADGIPNLDVPNLSANCPDLFAWLKFIELNAPAPDYPDLALWQTWATDPNTLEAEDQVGDAKKLVF